MFDIIKQEQKFVLGRWIGGDAGFANFVCITTERMIGMKITSDYVTNSSSANFILARKGKLSKKQIENLVKKIESEYLGEIVLRHDASEKEIKEYLDDAYLTDEQVKEIKAALKAGKDIYEGWVSFEGAEYHLGDLYEEIWDAVKGEENIDFIKEDLDY